MNLLYRLEILWKPDSYFIAILTLKEDQKVLTYFPNNLLKMLNFYVY